MIPKVLRVDSASSVVGYNGILVKNMGPIASVK
jgi:hypothetical protein